MISQLLLGLALFTLLLYVLGGTDTVLGNRSIRSLREIPPLPATGVPRISVVVAARNEERNIEEALQSVLRQDYPDLEVVVVDDRSTDSTGAILDRMAARSPMLRVVHLTDLPDG